MTDHEYKLDIIKRRFIQVGMEAGLSEEECTEGTIELMKEEKFIQVMTYCMDAWAGVISARIDESDNFERACIAASHYLSNDTEEIPDILRKLQELEDKEQLLDTSLDEILIWEKLVDSFTVENFLESIGL